MEGFEDGPADSADTAITAIAASTASTAITAAPAGLAGVAGPADFAEFADTAALVTGAAGGIGAAVVRTLAERGCAVAAVDRAGDALADSVAKLVADGLRVVAVPADVTDPARAEAAVEQAEAALGPLRYLVNAAGVLHPGEVAAMEDAAWDATIAVNATGVFLMSRAVVRRMIPRRAGALVTVGSNAAGTARTTMAAYAASKAAATMFTKCLGLEVAEYGIRCNVVAPGSTDTPMLRTLWNGSPEGLSRTLAGSPESYRVGIPLAKVARPEDVADAVAFLLSERSSHITLQTITVDGGATLGV